MGYDVYKIVKKEVFERESIFSFEIELKPLAEEVQIFEIHFAIGEFILFLRIICHNRK